jgi:hypothetical protein
MATSALPDAIFAGFTELRRRVRQFKKRVDDVQQRADAALFALGVPRADPAEHDVVDVGSGSGNIVIDTVKQLARRTSQGLMVLLAMSILGIALWSLGIFVGSALLAFVVVTRGLGLRIDIPVPRPA